MEKALSHNEMGKPQPSWEEKLWLPKNLINSLQNLAIDLLVQRINPKNVLKYTLEVKLQNSEICKTTRFSSASLCDQLELLRI